MFISAREVNWSVFTLLFSQFCNLLIVEKILSHYQYVTGNLHPIFKSTDKFGNLFAFHFFTDSASVECRDLVELENLYASIKATLDQQYQDLVDHCGKDQINLP